MGKVAKPVTIIVTEKEMLTWPVYAKLCEQGHAIIWLGAVYPIDELTHPFALVMGPRAHYLVEGMEACVPVALKKARVELYPAKGGRDE